MMILTRLRRLRVGLTDPWSWRSGSNMMIDFCVWALETDGLQVSPFNRHPDGSGELRECGLTRQAWWTWFADVVALQADLGASARAAVAPGYVPPAFDPPAVWAGTPTVGERLRELWKIYGTLSEQRRAWERNTDALIRSVSFRRLWDDLRPYHTRLVTLHVHLVAYPSPVECPVPPDALVLGINGTLPDGAAFHDAVLRGARNLVEGGNTSTT